MPACDVGVSGYAVANAVAEANLILGGSVVADCVNPVEASREEWRVVASTASARILEVEVVCLDEAEHRLRVEQRRPDIAGHELPSWEAVRGLYYEPWNRPHLVIDTGTLSPNDAANLVIDACN